VTKLILTLHGDLPVEDLRSESFRTTLAAAGVSALQLNLDDEPVAAALRFGPGEPVTGLASVWTTGEPAAVIDVVRGLVPIADAYLVSERVRLDPAPVADGVRSDVLAQVALLRRPESMSPEDYLSYWMIEHTPIAIRTQATSAYVQNIVEQVLTPGSPDLSAIVEEHFPMAGMTDPHAFYGSGGDDAELHRRMTELLTSVARFGADTGLDLVPTSRYLWSCAPARHP